MAANTLYPYGYSTAALQLTWDQMLTKKTVYLLHPEVRRRFHALIEKAASVGVPLGVGTGWRVQPRETPPGFASPGNSWHESCPVSPETPTALAIDTVPSTSWDWLHASCSVYGFRTFRYVNNEPWHIQPVEIPASRNFTTVLPPLVYWQLPDQSVPPVPTNYPPVGDDMPFFGPVFIQGTGKDGTQAGKVYKCDGNFQKIRPLTLEEFNGLKWWLAQSGFKHPQVTGTDPPTPVDLITAFGELEK